MRVWLDLCVGYESYIDLWEILQRTNCLVTIVQSLDA